MHIETQKNLQKNVGVDGRTIIIIRILKKETSVIDIMYFQVQ